MGVADRRISSRVTVWTFATAVSPPAPPAPIEFDKQAGYLYSVTVPEELPMIYETTYSNARAHLASLMDQVTDTREPILIRRRGAEPVALVAADELAGWMETAYLLRSPKNAQRLLDGNRRAAAGEGISLSIEQLRERLGLEGT